MDWESVLIEWVNCLRLTERPITEISEVSDGKFFCEILQIRFDKVVDIHDTFTVFYELENALKEQYFPSTWIDYNAASKGDERELVRILSVLIATCSLQEQQDTVFRKNPATYLSSLAQVEIKRYLQSVLQKSKLVSEEVLAAFTINFDKENRRPQHTKHFRKKLIPSRKVPESPHIYVSSPHTPILHNRREREVSDTEIRQAETIEKINAELLSKSSVISELESRNSELANKLAIKGTEIKCLNEKNAHLKERVDDLEKHSEGLTVELQAKCDEVSEIKDQLADLRSQVAKSDTENENLIRENVTLKKARDTAIEQTQLLEKELEKVVQANSEEAEKLSRDVDEKLHELEQMNERNLAYEVKCSNLVHSLESSKSSLEEAKINLQKSEEEFSISLNRLSVDLEKERQRAIDAEEALRTSQSTIESLEKSIRKLEENISENNDVISGLHSKISALEDTLEEKATENKSLNEENAHLKGKVGDLERLSQGLTVELQTKCDEVSEMKHQLADLRSQVAKSDTENENLLRENVTLQKARDAAIEHTQRLGEELEKVVQANSIAVEKLSRDVDEKQHELEEMKERNLTCEEKCSDLEHSLEEVKSNLQKSEEEFGNSLDRLSVDLEKERQRAIDAEDALKTSQNTIESLEKIISELEENVSENNDVISGLQLQVTEFENKLEQKGTEINSLHEENAHLKEEVGDLEKHSAGLTVELQTKCNEVSEIKDQLADLRSQVAKSDTENKNLIRENVALQKARDAAMEQTQLLQKELEKVVQANSVEVEKLSRDVDEKLHQLEEMKERNLACEEKCSDLEHSLEEAKINFKKSEEELNNSIGRLTVELENERQKIIDAEEALKTSQSTIESLEKSIRKLEENISENNDVITGLQLQISASADTLEKKATENKSLNEENAQLKEKVGDLEKLSQGLTVELQGKCDEVSEVRSQVAKSDTENKNLMTENVTLQEARDAALEQIRLLEEELEKVVQANSVEVEKLSRNVDEKLHKLEEMKERNLACEEKCSDLEHSLVEAKINLQKSREEFSNSLDRLSVDLEKERQKVIDAEEALKTSQSTIESLEKSIRESEETVCGKSIVIAELQSQVTELTDKQAENSNQINSLQKENARLKEKVDDLEKLSEKLTVELQAKCDEVSEVRSQVAKSDTENENLMRENATLQKARDTAIEQTRLVEKELEKVVQANSIEVEKLSRDVDKKHHELEEMKGRNLACEEKCSNLVQSLEEVKSNLQKSEEEFSISLNRLSVDLEKERQRATDAEEALKTSQSTIESLEKSLRELEESICGKSQVIAELQSQVTELENKLAQKGTDINSLNEENANLKEKVGDLEKLSEVLTVELQTKCDEVSEMKHQLADFRSQVAKSDTENENLMRENVTLQKARDAALEQTQLLEDELEKVVQANSVEIEKLSRDVDEKLHELEEMKQRNLTCEEKCSDLEHSLEEAKINLQKSDEEFGNSLGRLSVDLEKERQRAIDAEEALKTSQSTIESLEKSIRELEENVSEDKDVISGLQLQVTEFENKLEQKGTEINSLHEENAHLKVEVGDLEKHSAGLTVELQTKCDDVSEIKDQLADLRSQVAKSDTENENLKRENATLQKSRDAAIEHTQLLEEKLEKVVQANSVEVEKLSRDIDEKLHELEEMKEQSLAYEAKCSNLVHSLEEVKSILQKSEEEFSTSLNRLSVDLEKERQRVKDAEEALKTSQSTIESLEKSIRDLEETICGKSNVIAELQSQVTEFVNKLAETSTEVKCLHEENAHLKENVDDLEKLSKGLTVELQAKCDEVSEIKDQIADLRSQVAKSDIENENLMRENVTLQEARDAAIEHTQRLGEELEKVVQANSIEVEKLSRDVDEKLHKLEEMKERNLACEEKCSDLEHSLEEVKSNLQKSEEEFSISLNRLSVDLEKERQKVIDAEKALKTSQSTIESLEKSIGELEENISENNDVILGLKSQISALEDTLEEKVTENKSLNNENAHLKEKVGDLEKLSEKLTVELQGKCDEISEVKSQVAKSDTENENLMRESVNLQKARDAAMEQTKLLEEELEKVVQSNSVEVEKLSRDVDEKLNELEVLKEENMAYEAKCSNLVHSLESSKSSLEEAKINFQKSEVELNNSIGRLSVELEKERQKVIEAEEALKTSQSTIESLERNMRAVEESICGKNKVIAELQSEINKIDIAGSERKLQEKTAEFVEREKKLRLELKEKFGKKLDEMKTKMARITGAEIEKVQGELTRKQEDFSVLQKKLLQYEDEAIDLKRERGLLKSANIEANNRLFSLNEALNKKSLEYDSLRRKFEEVTLQLDLWKRKCDMLDVPDCSSIKGLSYAGSSVSSFQSNLGLDDRRSSCVSLASIKSNGSTSSRKFVPQGAGSMFTCEDEDDGFQFSDKHLADLHRSSRCLESTRTIDDDPQERINEIQRRNTLLPVHMRSCYPSEEFGSDLDENHLRVMNHNGTKLGAHPGLQRQYGTLSLSKLKDESWVDDSSATNYQQRTPLSPTSSRLNNAGMARPSTSLGFSPKPKMKSDSALTPGKRSKPSMFRVPFPRD